MSTSYFPSLTEPERRADFLIHAVSLFGFGAACLWLLRGLSQQDDSAVFAATIIYAVLALASILVSFAYHLYPRHEWRASLRRWDHAAIYTSIAGTFTPLLIKAGTASAHAILTAIWVLAIMGVLFKLSGDNGDSRWSLVSYLGLGAFAFVALPDFWAYLPPLTTYAVAAGAVFYTIGTAFYSKKGMRYRYPIWHSWGTLGGTSFFVSVWVAVTA
ncbi:MAG: hemolysin III family protein [Pseudomonadota bacterium]